MEFFSAYVRGFARVAACTHRTVLADPVANGESVLRIAAECHDGGVAVAVFPELTLTGYSIEDILLQDSLLDAVETSLADVVAGYFVVVVVAIAVISFFAWGLFGGEQGVSRHDPAG